jgi:hypothetical protein
LSPVAIALELGNKPNICCDEIKINCHPRK